MKKLISLFAFSAILLIGFSACKDQKELTTAQPERSFIMGSGGGITGKYVMYKIYNSGKIELQSEDLKTYSALTKIPSDSAQACFKALDALNIAAYPFDHPGNMTYIIEIEKDGKSHKIKWGDINHPIRKDFEAFFKRTRKMILAETP